MSTIAPARLSAYAVLRAVNSGKSDLPDAIAHTRAHLADERDRALSSEIAAGTLRWMGALDAVLVAYSRRAADRLDPEVLDILRIGAYQLLHLQRVPSSAVVHDAVEMAKARGKRSAAGLVNAVLRRVDRERNSLPLPARPPSGSDEAAALDYLSVTLSHPRWLVSRWLSRVGFENAEAWLLFNNRPAPLTLRVNNLLTDRNALSSRLSELGIGTEPTRYATFGLTVTKGQPLRHPVAEEGLFFVQDEASQLVAAFAEASPGERVLDTCAAPGGKTLAMAGEMKGEGLLVATDLRPRRLALLARGLRQAGAGAVRVVRSDAAAPLPFGPIFDAVLLDAPCSGLGTIQRDPEIRWRRTEPDLSALATRQLQMLHRASAVVRPGGRVVYATCSSEPEENELVIAAFLADRPDFSLVRGQDTAFGRGPGGIVIDEAGHLRTWPHVHALGAFFAATLRRRGPVAAL